MEQAGYRMLDTICIRTDLTIERIAYHPALFFEGQDVSMDNALGLRAYFEEETDLPCEVLISRKGPENLLAEELFYRAFGRQWSLHGDCVLNLGRSMSPAEMRVVEEFLLEVKEAAVSKENRRNDLKSAYWERIYDPTRANALIIAPDRKMTPIALGTQQMDTEIHRYFEMLSEEAYPVEVESENVRLLNESLQGQFRVRIFYDKMASYMGGIYNDYARWLTMEDEVCSDLMLVGDSPLHTEELAVLMKLMRALIDSYEAAEQQE